MVWAFQFLTHKFDLSFTLYYHQFCGTVFFHSFSFFCILLSVDKKFQIRPQGAHSTWKHCSVNTRYRYIDSFFFLDHTKRGTPGSKYRSISYLTVFFFTIIIAVYIRFMRAQCGLGTPHSPLNCFACLYRFPHNDFFHLKPRNKFQISHISHEFRKELGAGI